jgi:hypothetical protein
MTTQICKICRRERHRILCPNAPNGFGVGAVVLGVIALTVVLADAAGLGLSLNLLVVVILGMAFLALGMYIRSSRKGNRH